jgi:hypothetical protein
LAIPILYPVLDEERGKSISIHEEDDDDVNRMEKAEL